MTSSSSSASASLSIRPLVSPAGKPMRLGAALPLDVNGSSSPAAASAATADAAQTGAVALEVGRRYLARIVVCNVSLFPSGSPDISVSASTSGNQEISAEVVLRTESEETLPLAGQFRGFAAVEDGKAVISVGPFIIEGPAALHEGRMRICAVITAGGRDAGEHDPRPAPLVVAETCLFSVAQANPGAGQTAVLPKRILKRAPVVHASAALAESSSRGWRVPLLVGSVGVLLLAGVWLVRRTRK